VYVDYRPIQKLFWTTMWFIDLIEVFGLHAHVDNRSNWNILRTTSPCGLKV